MSQENIIDCSHCSAPIDFRIGDAVAYCIYCNGTTKLREITTDEKKYMLEPNFKREHIRKLLVGDVNKLPGVTDKMIANLQIVNAKLTFLPFYVVRTHGNTEWSGMGRQANFHNPYKGAYKSISFYTEPESGVFDDHAIYSIYAGTEEFSFLADYAMSSTGKKYFNLGEIELLSGEAIDATYDENQAEIYAYERMRNKHTNYLNQEVVSVDMRNEEFQVDEWQLVFVPFWFIDWKYSGEDNTYNAIIDGSSGQTVEMDTPRPKVYWLFAISSAVLMLLVGLIPLLFAYVQDGVVEFFELFSGFIGLVLMIYTFMLIRPKKFVEKIN